MNLTDDISVIASHTEEQRRYLPGIEGFFDFLHKNLERLINDQVFKGNLLIDERIKGLKLEQILAQSWQAHEALATLITERVSSPERHLPE